MSYKATQSNNKSYNNADSFAMAFDQAWEDYSSRTSSSKKTSSEKIEIILKEMQNHPFLKDSPEMAKQIAEFRLRLLNLE